ncbi:hypothetical protein DFH08DRAFT_824880 [Mycena albidolilacea]|uniref:Uncharacterized protein n=1 Tax=Mycena albidolilacea TaxID=1033008 RepID=A0AAD6Z388_9AGAR|nr:hypothetical protein DFH08DRAFT_824880 [Mycena albidolilacea]
MNVEAGQHRFQLRMQTGAWPSCVLASISSTHNNMLHCGIVLNDKNYVLKEVHKQLGLATHLLTDSLAIPAQRYGPHYAVSLTTPNPQNRIMESGVSQGRGCNKEQANGITCGCTKAHSSHIKHSKLDLCHWVAESSRVNYTGGRAIP